MHARTHARTHNKHRLMDLNLDFAPPPKPATVDKSYPASLRRNARGTTAAAARAQKRKQQAAASSAPSSSASNPRKPRGKKTFIEAPTTSDKSGDRPVALYAREVIEPLSATSLADVAARVATPEAAGECFCSRPGIVHACFCAFLFVIVRWLIGARREWPCCAPVTMTHLGCGDLTAQ